MLPAVVQSQVRSQVVPTGAVEFESWGKLQLAWRVDRSR